jgi:hypothetical protein
MIGLIRVLLPTLATLFHDRHDLVVENLLLRHQLKVAPRSHARPHLKSWDRFFWLVFRQLYPPGCGISSSSDRRPSSAGTVEAGASTGAGAQAVIWAGLG